MPRCAALTLAAALSSAPFQWVWIDARRGATCAALCRTAEGRSVRWPSSARGGGYATTLDRVCELLRDAVWWGSVPGGPTDHRVAAVGAATGATMRIAERTLWVPGVAPTGLFATPGGCCAHLPRPPQRDALSAARRRR